MRDAGTLKLAVFPPHKVVAYLAHHPPARALYVFKTSPTPATAVRLRYVSEPVDLLYVASTRRAADKATVALHVIERRIGSDGMSALPNLFWYRLADVVERRGRRVMYFVTRLLERELLPL